VVAVAISVEGCCLLLCLSPAYAMARLATRQGPLPAGPGRPSYYLSSETPRREVPHRPVLLRAGGPAAMWDVRALSGERQDGSLQLGQHRQQRCGSRQRGPGRRPRRPRDYHYGLRCRSRGRRLLRARRRLSTSKHAANNNQRPVAGSAAPPATARPERACARPR